MHKKAKWEWITWYDGKLNELLWKHAWHEELTWLENLAVMEIML